MFLDFLFHFWILKKLVLLRFSLKLIAIWAFFKKYIKTWVWNILMYLHFNFFVFFFYFPSNFFLCWLNMSCDIIGYAFIHIFNPAVSTSCLQGMYPWFLCWSKIVFYSSLIFWLLLIIFLSITFFLLFHFAVTLLLNMEISSAVNVNINSKVSNYSIFEVSFVYNQYKNYFLTSLT